MYCMYPVGVSIQQSGTLYGCDETNIRPDERHPPDAPNPSDRSMSLQEPLLVDYWEARDAGNFSEALVSLKLVEADLAAPLTTGIPAGLSTYADLATFAKCGSTVGMMRDPRNGSGSGNGNGNGDRSNARGSVGARGEGTLPKNIRADGGVCVVAMDSGTWPLYGGGVAVCRKQLLDDTVGRVRWNALFEVALPAPLPNTVEIPENIRQIMPVPLWTQNAGGAYETFLAHTSFITRALRETRTSNAAINAFFIPQLKTLIDLANTPGDSVSVGGLEVAATAIAEIYAYFQVGLESNSTRLCRMPTWYTPCAICHTPCVTRQWFVPFPDARHAMPCHAMPCQAILCGVPGGR